MVHYLNSSKYDHNNNNWFQTEIALLQLIFRKIIVWVLFGLYLNEIGILQLQQQRQRIDACKKSKYDQQQQITLMRNWLIDDVQKAKMSWDIQATVVNFPFDGRSILGNCDSSSLPPPWPCPHVTVCGNAKPSIETEWSRRGEN